MKSKDMNSGGYQYIPGVMQYSGGVAAKVGYKIVRARFLDLQPMEQGFQKIEQHLESVQRPLDAFCACELRSPAQFSQQGFADFNRCHEAIPHSLGMAPYRWGAYQIIA